jgi:branched-chain amino acid transport system ATP-binding protein
MSAARPPEGAQAPLGGSAVHEVTSVGADTTSALIAAAGLQTYYGASHILRGVDFQVGRGETIGLMGRNGMGKSTLLKTLMGLVQPRAGSVRVMGREMVGRPPFEVAQLGVAYVPEGRGIFGNLSVVENLKMAARPGRRGHGADEWTFERVLETFPRLKERLGHGGQQLSGGEQQMLTIGRALMTNPEVLILDEATEGLAPMIAREIWRICELIRASGISSVIVDKNWKHLTRITDRNVILVKGQVVFAGTSDELRSQPRLLEQHLGV